MALVVKYIDPNEPPGGDGSLGAPYSGLDEWNVNEATNLSVDGDQHVARCRSGSDTIATNISSWISDSINYLRIEADAGHEHKGVLGDGYNYEPSVTSAAALRIDTAYVELADITIRNTHTGQYGDALNGASNANMYGVRLIMETLGFQARALHLVDSSANNSDFEACLFICNNNLAFSHLNFRTFTLWNCTLKSNANGIGGGAAGADVFFYNTVSHVNGAAWDSATKYKGDANASSDATAPGTNPVFNVPDTAFTDRANKDFTISGTDSELYDSGSAANQAPFDITGQPYTTNDIGCYAYIGETPSEPVDVDLPSKQVHTRAFAPSVEAPSPANSDIPSKQVHVQAFAPQVTVPTGADVGLPSKQVHVQAFAPSIEAPTDANVGLPSKQVHVQAFAPQVTVPSGADVGLPSKQVHVQAFVPSIDAPTDANVGLPSKQVHVQAFAPQIFVPSGADVDLPSKQVHVQAFVPSIDAPTDVDVGIPSKQIHVRAFAPMTTVGDEEISLLPTQYVHVQAFAPQIDAPTDVDVDLPSKQVHVQAFAPTVEAGAGTDILLPSKQVHVQAFAPTVDAASDFIVNLPTKYIHVQAFAPRVQAGVDAGNTFWEAVEDIKQYIKPQIEALGLTQIMWPDIPIKRDSHKPFVQVSVNIEDREMADLGGVHRTIGNLVTVLHTPYGNNPGSHNRYVDGLMKMVSNTSLNGYILFFSSIPTTVGRRDSWWSTGIETQFYLENV